jgi:catechol 2,3-dioxygenase-like lactoylglutathione lyase family enzyme
MKMIPIFRCRNMKDAIFFYTTILDFELKEAGASPDDWVVALTNGDAELLLTTLEGDQKIGIAANVLVEDIDSFFEKYIRRGLDTSNKEGSPVHQGPLNQSWGNREFYVTDADGNTLRFVQPINDYNEK